MVRLEQWVKGDTMLTLIKGIGNAKYISLIVGTEKEKQPNMIRREIYEVFLAGVLLSMISWSSASGMYHTVQCADLIS